MIGGNVNDFLDHVTYEEEAIQYHGKKYFFHGLLRNPDTGNYEFTIDLWDENDWYIETVYHVSDSNAVACINRFLSDVIIENHRFWEIEKEAEWIDW